MNIDTHFEGYPYYCQWIAPHVGVCTHPDTGLRIDLRIERATSGQWVVWIRRPCSVADAVCDSWREYATAVCHADERPCFVWRR